MDIRYFLMGFVVGIGSVAPGISGGSMAIAFGIYERLVGCVVGFKKRIKAELPFLIRFCAGAIVGIAFFAVVLSFLFEKYETVMQMLFAGFMLGTFPSVFKTSCSQGYKKKYPVIFLAAMCISLFGLKLIGNRYTMELNSTTAFLGGAIIGIGTIVPGISGSAVLMALGLYRPLLERCVGADMSVIIPLGIGAIVTALLLLKLIEWLFSIAYGGASFAFFGLLAASTAAIIPPMTGFGLKFVIGILFAVFGAVISILFNKKYCSSKPNKLTHGNE